MSLCKHTVKLRRAPVCGEIRPPSPINSIDVTARNQLDRWAGVILSFISAVVTAKLLANFFPLAFTFFLPCWPLLKFSYPLLCPSTIFLHILPISSCYYSFLPVPFDISKHISYLLFGTRKGHRNEGMPLWHMPPFLFPLIHGLCEWFDCNCQWVPPDSPVNFRSVLAVLDSWEETAVLSCPLVFLHVCICFMKTKWDTERRSVCTVANRWLCELRSSEPLSILVPSMLLTLQGEQGFLPPPLSVHPAMDERHSHCSLTRLPHTKVALQLLWGSAVWSCPVWLQTKHQRDSGTTSDHQTGLHVILTSFTRGERRWTQTFHILCETLTFCHHALPVCIFSVQTFGLICLCVSVCVFPSNFRTTPSPLWQMYCSSQFVTITMLMHLVQIVYVWCESDWQPDTIRCPQELSTALALKL